MTVQQAYDGFVSTDGDELWERIDAAHRRFGELVASTGPDVIGTGTTWTARDVAAHILTVLLRYTARDIRSSEGLGDTPRAVDEINARELRELDGVGIGELMPRLDEALAAVRASFGPDRMDLHERFPFHGGTTIDGAGGLSNIVGEYLIHGFDIARAAGYPWPIASRDALLVLNGVMQLLPAYAEPSARGSLIVMWRVPGAADWIMHFDNGKAVSRAAAPGERAHVIMAAPPETLMLFLYQRLGQGAALRRGLRVAGGRRPWRIVQMQKFLQKP